MGEEGRGKASCAGDEGTSQDPAAWGYRTLLSNSSCGASRGVTVPHNSLRKVNLCTPMYSCAGAGTAGGLVGGQEGHQAHV